MSDADVESIGTADTDEIMIEMPAAEAPERRRSPFDLFGAYSSPKTRSGVRNEKSVFDRPVRTYAEAPLETPSRANEAASWFDLRPKKRKGIP